MVFASSNGNQEALYVFLLRVGSGIIDGLGKIQYLFSDCAAMALAFLAEESLQSIITGLVLALALSPTCRSAHGEPIRIFPLVLYRGHATT